MRPTGRQCASGLSLLFSATRCFRASAPHAVNGRPSFKVDPIFQNCLGRVPGAAAAGPVSDAAAALIACQTPGRSGFPSGVLGVGPSSTGLPSWVLGTLVELKEGHWA